MGQGKYSNRVEGDKHVGTAVVDAPYTAFEKEGFSHHPGLIDNNNNSGRKEVLNQFRSLVHAVIDASSIIYMKKAGFLHILATALELYAPHEVLQETGFAILPIQGIPSEKTQMANDEKLLALALARRAPVISEDKKVLRQAKKEGLVYFNALMMLHFLLFKKKVGQKKHTQCYERLKSVAWYSEKVLLRGDEVYRWIRQKQPAQPLLPG